MHPALSVLVYGGLPAAAGCCWLAAQRVGRLRYYRRLAESRDALTAGVLPEWRLGDPAALAETFAQDALARTGEVLEPRSLARLQDECQANRNRCERSYLPGHKKGGTLSYERVHLHAPACLAVYHSDVLRRWISRVVGVEVQPTADHDQSSCSILFYDEPGDHIHWHYDHNFYDGRHFTVLLSVVNRRATGGPSAGTLERKTVAGEVRAVDTCENSLVIFEGKRVRHRASPVGPDDTRIMLSMTFATESRIGWGWELLRRAKDTAYFGPRVLWQ